MQFTLATTLLALLTLTAAAPVDPRDALIARHPVQPRSAVPSGGYASPTGTGIYSYATGTATATYATGTAVAGSKPCSDNGAVVCNGPSEFGICSWGRVVFQPVAAGTKCEGGMISKA